MNSEKKPPELNPNNHLNNEPESVYSFRHQGKEGFEISKKILEKTAQEIGQKLGIPPQEVTFVQVIEELAKRQNLN